VGPWRIETLGGAARRRIVRVGGEGYHAVMTNVPEADRAADLFSKGFT
jgi:hypothetical protein